MSVRGFSARVLALLLSVAMIAVSAEASGPGPVLPDPGKVGMSREQQQQVGLQAAGEVYKQMPVLPDSNPVTQYVQQLGKKLETVIPPDKSWPYQFHVVQSADINAFALPGGPIFINLGTIQAAENEAELAGVMAHEMSHVYMQHSAKQAPKAETAQIIAGLAGAVLGGSAGGRLASMGIQFGAGTLLMKYSRKDEAQADAVGAIIMYKAGYNPQAMADFFTKLEQKYGNGGPQLLSDHPNPGNRQQAIRNQIKSWPAINYQTTSAAFTKAKQEATGMKTYSAQEIAQGAKSGTWAQQNQKNGAMPPAGAAVPASAQGGGGQPPADVSNVSYDQVKPTGKFTQFQGQGFSISHPDNWQPTSGQNQVFIVPPGAAGNGGVAYGALISSAQGAPGNLDQATQQLAQSLIQQNPGMQAAGNPSAINVNGLEGRSMYLTGQSPIQKNGKPEPERDWLVTVPGAQGSLSYLVFIAPESDFDRLKPTFQKMLESFRAQ
ncbi:MAG TPA: M48 family metallopeptidase [Candidatus Angelobacter sp.]|nr:M48 family metallopeptidase [Candidatus Angelobacter sp.]